MNTKIVRIFNTYGPRMRLNDGRAIPAFFSQALTGRPLTVFGDGSQTRSLCYIDDMVNGIEKLLFSDLNDPVNIGNPDEMSMLDLAQKIIQMTGSSSVIEHQPLPVDDPRVRRPDISRARKYLSWSPEIALDEGLKRTVAYFRQVMGG